MTREEIRETNYGQYFETLLEILEPDRKQERRLVAWWPEKGVYEYIEAKHRHGGNLLLAMRDLKNKALEVTGGR